MSGLTSAATRFMESPTALRPRLATMNPTTRWERGSVSHSTQGFSRRMDFPESDRVGEGAAGRTPALRRGSVSRSAPLQRQVLRVTDRRSGTAGSWRESLGAFSARLAPRTAVDRNLVTYVTENWTNVQRTAYLPNNSLALARIFPCFMSDSPTRIAVAPHRASRSTSAWL